jgi:hypothetical protein
MELLTNDLSLNGQFPDLASFRIAIERVITMRRLAGRFGRALHCHRNMAYARVTATVSMPQAIQVFALEQRRVLVSWLHQYGPFWEEARVHGPNEYLECNGDVVTDTAVGEAGYCRLHGVDSRLVSLRPSPWEFSPVAVSWVPDFGDPRTVDVPNYVDPQTLEQALRLAPPLLQTWKNLETMSVARFTDLTFAEDAFQYLEGYPFVRGAAYQLLARLETLNQLKTCFDENGERTEEGHRIYQTYFTGDRAWFSDSSDSEKRDFETELTFPHPTQEGEELFCPWHGKVNTPKLRVHFSWPMRADEPVFIVYVGPKITKQ